MSPYLGSFYAVLSGFLYGLLGYFGINLLLLGHSVFNMLSLRFFISALFMLLLSFLSKIQWREISRKDILYSFLSGIFLYSGGAILYFIAAQDIGSGLSMVIFFCYPVFVILFKHLHERTWCDRSTVLSLLFILSGVYLMADPIMPQGSTQGMLIAFLSSLFYAAYIISSDKVNLPRTLNTCVVSLGCAISCCLLSLFDSSLHWPVFVIEYYYLIGAGVISTALPILFFLKSLDHISMEKASILSVVEPICVLLIGVYLLDEKISWWQIQGSVMMTIGALIALLSPMGDLKENT